MKRYPEDAWERALKVQEVMLRARAKKITGWQAAEIIGLSDRSMRRGRGRYTAEGNPLDRGSGAKEEAWRRRAATGGGANLSRPPGFFGQRPKRKTMKTTKADRSCATKTGHFHLLTTLLSPPVSLADDLSGAISR